MLTEFETRLADVLGARLPAPFGGRVRRRGAADPAGSGPVIRLAVAAVEPLEPDLGSVRPEVLPGSADQRRVVRLGVTVGLDVAPDPVGDRLQQLRGLDALLFELDHPELRSAAALVEPGDQGFRLDGLRLRAGAPDLVADVLVTGTGWFWPVGVTGQTGRPIDRALVRELRLPVRLEVGAPLLVGGPAVPLGLTLGTTGTLVVRRGSTGAEPFGDLAVRLFDGAGGPGAGTLSGGTAGPEGSRRVAVAAGSVAALDYTPPAAAGTDVLTVAAYARDADGGERLGAELARFDLAVTP